MSYLELAILNFNYGNLKESMDALKQARSFTSKDFTKIDLAALHYKLKLLDPSLIEIINFDVFEEFPAGKIEIIQNYLRNNKNNSFSYEKITKFLIK